VLVLVSAVIEPDPLPSRLFVDAILGERLRFFLLRAVILILSNQSVELVIPLTDSSNQALKVAEYVPITQASPTL
jgi:hypothetical protein